MLSSVKLKLNAEEETENHVYFTEASHKDHKGVYEK